LAPLLGALAAGNCAMISPSEKCPATAALLARFLPAFCEGVAVVEGDAAVTAELASWRWGKIFFTGSTRVGRLVARQAAETLTPVCLELGGKTPVIVHRSADIDVAARRIAWGKTVNCGQTCIAPDYVVVERAVAQRLVDALVRALRNFYGDDAAASPDYGRMVDTAAVARMRALLVDHGGALVLGGRGDEALRFFAPTLVVEPREESALMGEEIFGPLLPILVVDTADDALALVARRCAQHAPLSLYVFSAEPAFTDRAIRSLPSGSVLINDVLLHFGNPNLPFGGVGASGQGKYHGASSFRCFSHERSVLERSSHRLLEVERVVRYPPYTPWHVYGVKLFLQRLPQVPTRPLRKLALLVAVVAVVLALRARGYSLQLVPRAAHR
jgi:aldehyde dehydrogenase (NAD+)